MPSKRPPVTTDLMPAVLYCRVSDPRQAEKDLSLPAQKKALREWAEGNGYIIVKEYIEPGVSARDENRPVFRLMIGELLTGEKVNAQTILVVHTSRFMRNTEATFVYRRKLEAKGVRVVSMTQPMEDNPAGKLMETIFAAFDQYESDMNAYRTMAAMRENAECGHFNGSKAPFGFRVTKVTIGRNERGKLVPNEEEAPIARVVFTLCVEGKGAKAIAYELNKRGVSYRGRSWSKRPLPERTSGERSTRRPENSATAQSGCPSPWSPSSSGISLTSRSRFVAHARRIRARDVRRRVRCFSLGF
jgi:DNA invertase Pin-like site-specific DNA recombinase